MIKIQTEDFSLDEALEHLSKNGAGGVAFFLGVVREGREQKVDTIYVEAYNEAALRELRRMRQEAIQKFSLTDAVVIHRVGKLRVGENIVLIGASAPHRRDALRACDWMINRLKMQVPIWKKEIGPHVETWVVNTPSPNALPEVA